MNNKGYAIFLLWGYLLITSLPGVASSFYPYYQQNSAKPPTAYPNYGNTRSPQSHISPNSQESFYPKASKNPEPVELLERSISHTMAFLAQPKSSDYQAISRFVIAQMAPNFDFEYMSRWIAGRYYQRFTPQQRKKFEHTFRELFISTLVQKLRRFKPSLNGAEVFRSKRLSRHEAIANVQIIHSQQQKISLDFRFLNSPKGWKVVDIKANGISALMHYRRYFAEKIRQRRS